MTDGARADRCVKTLSIPDADGAPIAGGELEWVPIRRALGVRAFGVNAFRAARAGDPAVEEHVESPGQEELYLVVDGSARFVVDGEAVDAAAGTLVFVDRPEARRSAIALEDGTVVVAVGGWPDRAYHPLPWEPIYLAQDAMRRGAWDEAAQTLEREAGEHRDSAFVRYRLAHCHARAGDEDRALTALRGAIEIDPAMFERAAGDEAFEALRRRSDWPAPG